MTKILTLLPKNVMGGLIMNGLADVFALNKSRVMRKFVKELIAKSGNFEVIKNHNFSARARCILEKIAA